MVYDSAFPVQGAQVRPLVGELRSHILMVQPRGCPYCGHSGSRLTSRVDHFQRCAQWASERGSNGN